MKTQLSKPKMKFALFILSFVFVFGFFSFSQNALAGLPANIVTSPAPNPVGSSGGSGNYQPITPGFNSIFGNTGDSFERMLARIFEISIYFTVILSVIMIIFGGIEYMGSESIFKKGEGKERIFAAIGGLLIALVSILVLSTIQRTPGGADAFEINIFGK